MLGFLRAKLMSWFGSKAKTVSVQRCGIPRVWVLLRKPRGAFARQRWDRYGDRKCLNVDQVIEAGANPWYCQLFHAAHKLAGCRRLAQRKRSKS